MTADAALRKAMETGELDGLMDALHANAETASSEALEEARALRDKLRDEKHAAAAMPGPDKAVGSSTPDKAVGSSTTNKAADSSTPDKAVGSSTPDKAVGSLMPDKAVGSSKLSKWASEDVLSEVFF